MLNASGSPRLPIALCAALTALLIAAPDQAHAQAWPNRTITAIVPFAAGNANDIVARIVLDQVSKQVGQPIVLENRPGAGGITGVAAAARAAPDGYTMLVHSSSFSASYSLHKQLPYDTFKDFAAVVPLGFQPTVLVVAAVEAVEDAGRARRRGQGEARRAQLRLRRRRRRVASRGRALPAERRLRGAAHSVQGPGRGADRGDDRPHRLLLPAGRAGAQPDQRRQGPRARGQHVQARGGAAGRADHRRGRPQGRGLCVLERAVRPGEDPGRHRQPPARRNREGARGRLGAGAARQDRPGAAGR